MVPQNHWRALPGLRQSVRMAWTTRICTPEDAPAVLVAFNALDVAEFGQPVMDLDEVTSALQADLAWVAVDGEVVGFASVSAKGECETVADPSYDPALREALLDLVIGEGRALGARTLEHWAGPGMRVSGPLLEARGFVHARTSWELRRELVNLSAPAWPDGVELAVFEPARDGRGVWTLVTEAFATGGFSKQRPYDEWAAMMLVDVEVVCAVHDGKLVGCATVGTRLGEGHVRQLAVASEARGTGLGRALLLEAFHRSAAAGRTSLTLDVDGDNEGARRLYDSVGMTVTQEYWRWDLVL
jgi:mycothiol synthase